MAAEGERIAEVNVGIGADASELASELQKAEKALVATGERFQQLGASMSQMGNSLSLGLTAPILGLGAGALKAAADWETAMTMVSKTVDAPIATLNKLGKEFISISEEIPVAAGELANLAALAGQLGIETENIVGFTKTMAALGVTTNLSAEEAADALARLANITGMSQKDFDKLGSVIVELGNNLATTEREIVDFGLRIAGAGAIAGLTEAEIMSIGAAMSSVGIEAEAGGTAVQKVLLGMTEAVATGNEHLGVFAQTAGMSASEFARVFKEDASEAFTLFVEGLGRQGQQAFGTLEALELQDQRLIRAFLSLSGAGDLLRTSIGLGTGAWEENIALTVEAEKFYGTLSNQLNVLKNTVVNIAAEFGAALRPAFDQLLALIPGLLDKLRQLVGIFTDLSPEMQATIIAIAGVAAAIGPVLVVGGMLLTLIGSSIKSYALLRTTLIQHTVAQASSAVATEGAAVAQAKLSTAVGTLALRFAAITAIIGTVTYGIKTFRDAADGSASTLQTVLSPMVVLAGKAAEDMGDRWEVMAAQMHLPAPVADAVAAAFRHVTGEAGSMTEQFVETGQMSQRASEIIDEYAERLRLAGASEEQVQEASAGLSIVLAEEERQTAATQAEWARYNQQLDALGPIGEQVRVTLMNIANQGLAAVQNAVADAGNEILNLMAISARFSGAQQQLRTVTAETAEEFRVQQEWLGKMIPALAGSAAAAEEAGEGQRNAGGATSEHTQKISEQQKAINAATDAMRGEIDQLTGVEGWERKLADALAVATPAQREQLQALAESVRQHDAAAKATERNKEAQEEFAEEVQRVVDANNEHDDAVRETIQSLELERIRIEEGEEAYELARLELEDYTDEEREAIRVRMEANQSLAREKEAAEELADAIGGWLNDALKENKERQDDAREAFDRAQEAFENSRAGFADRIQQLQLENLRLTEGEEAYMRRKLALEGATQEEIELIMALERSNAALAASQAAAEAVTEAQKAYEEATATVTEAQKNYEDATNEVAVAQNLLATATGDQVQPAQEALDLALREQADALRVLEEATGDQETALQTLNKATADADLAQEELALATNAAELASKDLATTNIDVVAPSMAEAERAVGETERGLDDFGGGIKDKLLPILSTFFKGDLPGFLTDWKGLWETCKGVLTTFGGELPGFLEPITGVFKTWIGKLGEIFDIDFGGIFKKLGGKFIDWITDFIPFFDETLTPQLTSIAKKAAIVATKVGLEAVAVTAGTTGTGAGMGIGITGGVAGAGGGTTAAGAGTTTAAVGGGGVLANVAGGALVPVVSLGVSFGGEALFDALSGDDSWTKVHERTLAWAKSVQDADAEWNEMLERQTGTGAEMVGWGYEPQTVVLEVDGYKLGEVALKYGVESTRLRTGLEVY